MFHSRYQNGRKILCIEKPPVERMTQELITRFSKLKTESVKLIYFLKTNY